MTSGLKGVIAAETVLSHLDGEEGTIWVRGHTVQDLVTNYGYEGAIALLWEKFAGHGLTRPGMSAALGTGRQLAFGRLDQWFHQALERPLVEGIRICLAALPETSTPMEIAAALPVAIAALLRAEQGAAPVAPDPTLGTAA